MGALTQNILTETIVAQKTYQNLISIAILNSHATDSLRVQQANGTYIVLASNQSVVLNADAGSVLPDITILTNATNLEAQIVAK